MSMMRQLDRELDRALEQELLGEMETAPVLHPRIRIRYAASGTGNRRSSATREFEAFNPSPPARGTILLTRFAFAKATLTAQHRAIIKRVATAIITKMATAPALNCIVVSIQGHEDEVGDPAGYGNVGALRAKAVAEALALQLTQLMRRVPAANLRNVEIRVTSAGPTRPIRSNATADGRALNRRVEIRLAVSDRCGGGVVV